MVRAEAELVSRFVSGMTRCRLQPGDRRSISRFAAEAMDIFRSLPVEHYLNITVTRDGLLVNGSLVSPDTPEAKHFFMKLKLKKVSKITIGKGVQAEELERFFADLSSSGGFVQSYENIAISTIRHQQPGEASPAGRYRKDDLHHVRQIFRDISVYKNVNMITIDAVVGGLVAKVRKGSGVPSMRVSTQIDANDLSVHAANVAMLSIVQAEHLGFGNALLHSIGLAALLHDIGKTLLPEKILERQDSLLEEEWAVMKEHPVYGAALLASLNKIPEIAIVVAYEHHMKYDGSGYPDTRRKSKKQHIVSQIVAIADFYCAMSTDLPHRKPLGKDATLKLLIAAAGREFNPLLVANFVQASKAARKQ
jgi:HD-GYP domain-containing protein (c-di-GMP phosphodiesterase class II)